MIRNKSEYDFQSLVLREPQNHIDQFYFPDAAGDLDHDGLSNLFEYQHNLSMTQADTDHDGIDDVKELHYRNVTRGPPLKESISNCRNTNVEKD